MQQALSALRGIVATPARFDPARDARSFTLYLTDLGEAHFLPRLLAKLRQQGPHVHLRTRPMPAHDPQAALERGEVDLAIGHLPDMQAGFYQQRLFRERYVCLARPGHALAQPGFGLEAFCQAEHAVVVPHGTGHSVVEQGLLRLGLAERIVLRVQNFLVLPAIVAQTDLLALLPHSVARQLGTAQTLQLLPCPLDLPGFDVRQCWHERFHRDPANQWLRALIADTFTVAEPVAAAAEGQRPKSSGRPT